MNKQANKQTDNKQRNTYYQSKRSKQRQMQSDKLMEKDILIKPKSQTEKDFVTEKKIGGDHQSNGKTGRSELE